MTADRRAGQCAWLARARARRASRSSPRRRGSRSSPALLQAFVLHDPTAGIPADAARVPSAGVVAARRIGPVAGEPVADRGGGLALGAGAIGWLASAEVRAVLAASRASAALGDALAANPGGWVAAVAFVRGIAYARLPPDPRPIGTALAIGTPGIALAALVGGMVGEPWRGRSSPTPRSRSWSSSSPAIAALTLSRLTLVGSGGGGGVDWRRNPAWLGFAGRAAGRDRRPGRRDVARRRSRDRGVLRRRDPARPRARACSRASTGRACGSSR